jgi:EAL domain-containing protein (putative c-di-GMP-specific phosphodiesterase class I)
VQLRYLAFRSSKSDLSRFSGRAVASPKRRLSPHLDKPTPDSPDPREILNSIGQTLYDWDLHSDRISWGPNAASILGIAVDAISTGRAFAEFLSQDSETSRHEAIFRSTAIDAGTGALFLICYGLNSPDRPRDAAIWVEDSGRWFAGPDGRPSRAHGLVRVMTDLQQESHAFRSRFASRPGAPRVVISEPSLAGDDTRLPARKISDEIVSALHDRRFMIALQPLVDAKTGVPAMHEALMRLRRADGALALPAAILPTAEKSGLIQLIDRRVLELGLKKLREDPDMRIAVNVSGHTLHNPDFFVRLSATLESCKEIARRLTIELTETCVIEDVEATIRAVSVIRKLGPKVAMDDFGAGHTSFKNLRRCEFDLVKIDGAFIQNLARSSDDRFFVRTLIELARHIGIPVVAEWVENEETAKILRDWDVNYLQGNYFGAAVVSASDLRACTV